MTDLDALIAQAAATHGVPPDLVTRVVAAESGGNPNAVSPKGASGLMQLMPATARSLGVTNALDPTQNVYAGTSYLGQLLRKYGDPSTALTAYNWGPGNVDKFGPDAAPTETKAYVAKITGGAPTQQAQPSAAPDEVSSWLAQFAKTGQVAPAQPAAAPAAAPAQPADEVSNWLAQFAKTGKAGTSASPQPAAAPAPTQSAPDATIAMPDKTQAYLGASPSELIPATVHGVGFGLNNAANAVQQGLAWLANTVAPNSGIAQSLQRQANADTSTVRSAEGAYQGQLSPAGQSLYGAAQLGAGMVAPGSSLLRAGTLLPRVLGGAASGLGATAAQDAPQLQPGQTYMQQMGPQLATGAVLGAALPVGASAASSLYKGAKSAFEGAVLPITNPSQAAAKSLADTVNRLSPNTPLQIRPQAGPLAETLDQASDNPAVAAWAKALYNTPDGKAQQVLRNTANNDQVLATLRNMAGTPDSLNAAIGARSAAVQPFVQQMQQTTVNAEPILAQINAALQSPMGVRSVPQTALNKMRTSIVNAAGASGGDVTAVRADMLDAVRQNANDLLKESANRVFGIPKVAAQDAAAIQPVKSAIEGALTQALPDAFPAYLQTYAQQSAPINRMVASNTILDKLGRGASAINQEAMITPTAYRSAVKQTLQGMKYPLASDDMRTLASLNRSFRAIQSGEQAIKSVGSDTAYNNAASSLLYGNGYSGSTIGRAIGTGIGTFAGATHGGPATAVLGAMAGGAGGKLFDGVLNNAAQNVRAAQINMLMNPQGPDAMLAIQLLQRLQNQPRTLMQSALPFAPGLVAYRAQQSAPGQGGN